MSETIPGDSGSNTAGGMADFDERALIERCRTGDDIAFGELVDRYKNLVYGMVWRMVGDRSQADDLAQEVFLKVYRGLPYFRGEARLSTWIYRIVANVCTQARSSRRAERPTLSPVREPGAADTASSARRVARSPSPT